MSLKILGGIAQNHTLKVPDGYQIRPMAVMLKRRLFDMYQDFTGVHFYDACAGSGAVGIEAWSRGASAIYFNELHAKVFPYLKNNIGMLKEKFEEETSVRPLHLHKGDCAKWPGEILIHYESLSPLDKENAVFFLAPPYSLADTYKKTLLKLHDSPWFKGQVWIESDRDKGSSLEDLKLWGKTPYKIIEQGSTFLMLINWAPNSQQ